MAKSILKKISAIALSMAVAAPMVAIDAGKAQAGIEPYLGEMMLVGFDYCPRGWARADGLEIPIANHSALFALFGTRFGGDGRVTFNLPDLRGRVPVHQGTGQGLSPKQMGQRFGVESVTLGIAEMPRHSHRVIATNSDANKNGPGDDLLAKKIGNPMYHDANTPSDQLKEMDPRMIAPEGQGRPFENRSPSLVMNWCVSMEGSFPPRN